MLSEVPTGYHPEAGKLQKLSLNDNGFMGFSGRALLIFGGPCVQEDAANLSPGIQWTGRAMPLEGLGFDFNCLVSDCIPP